MMGTYQILSNFDEWIEERMQSAHERMERAFPQLNWDWDKLAETKGDPKKNSLSTCGTLASHPMVTNDNTIGGSFSGNVTVTRRKQKREQLD